METLTIKAAFKYPFNRAKGMWNILWILIPIIGWFALGGYIVRIIKGFLKGNFKKLPIFSFRSDLELGCTMFLKSLPFLIAYTIAALILSAISPVLRYIMEILIIPILTINFINKQTIESYFEFKIIKHVFNNFGDYIVMILKGILLALIFLVMCVILVGFPAGAFTESIFIADFYNRRVK